MNQTLFPASVVGSMPRPDFVRDLISPASSLSDDDYRRRMDSAISYVVALQEQAGVDVLTDGEWRRKSYIGVIAELANGFELGTNPRDGRPWTTVIERVTPKNPGFIAEEVRFLKRITKVKVKATLPAPALLGERMWDPVRSGGAYPEPRDFVREVVPILRSEVERLVEAGVDIVQIDDPHLCLFVDPEVRARYEDPDEAAAFSVEMVNQVADGIEGVKLALHLCRRAGARARGEKSHRGGYEPILDHLNSLKVHHLTMEFTAPDSGDASVLGKLRDDFEIGLGCVSVQPGQVDSPQTVVDRVKQALRHLPPERITLNPDCGFAPGSGARVSIDEAYEKLRNEVEAARILRKEFGGTN